MMNKKKRWEKTAAATTVNPNTTTDLLEVNSKMQPCAPNQPNTCNVTKFKKCYTIVQLRSIGCGEGHFNQGLKIGARGRGGGYYERVEHLPARFLNFVIPSFS